MIEVEKIVPISPTAVRVEFGAEHTGHPGLIDPDAYAFNNGLEVVGVMRIDERTFEVQTTPQKADVAYDLEVSCEEEAKKS